jgi:hypothetical protein
VHHTRAPKLQPNVTGHDTPEVHPDSVERTGTTSQGEGTAHAETLPDLEAWREVGWIFRDGGCIAIERRGDQTRQRTLGD